MMNKKAFEMEFVMNIILWVIFFGLAIIGVVFLVKKLTM